MFTRSIKQSFAYHILKLYCDLARCQILAIANCVSERCFHLHVHRWCLGYGGSFKLRRQAAHTNLLELAWPGWGYANGERGPRRPENERAGLRRTRTFIRTSGRLQGFAFSSSSLEIFVFLPFSQVCLGPFHHAAL